MKKNIARTVVCMAFVITLLGCSGGSSGGSAPDTMTITISSPSGTVTTTYIEGSYNSQGILDPSIGSFVSTSYTYISLHSGVSPTSEELLLNITVGGITPQVYPIDLLVNNGLTDIFYESNNTTYATIFTSPSGTITLSSIGNVGEKITGSFDSIVTLMSTTSTDVLSMSGTFSVTRDN